jgi:hypothetical protein
LNSKLKAIQGNKKHREASIDQIYGDDFIKIKEF